MTFEEEKNDRRGWAEKEEPLGKRNKTMKTLLECNNEAARQIGYKDMDEMFSLLGNHSIKDARHSQFFLVLSDGAEIYASQFREPSSPTVKESETGEQEELLKLKEVLKSESVFWALRNAVKSPSTLGDVEDDKYYDLYNIVCELRKPLDR